MFPLLTCLDLLRCMGLLKPTSIWTRLSRFGILELEHAECSYVNCVLNRFVVADFGHLADWWLSPLLLKAFGRSTGLGIVCRIMTNDLFGTKKHGYLLIKGGPTKRQLT